MVLDLSEDQGFAELDHRWAPCTLEDVATLNPKP